MSYFIIFDKETNKNMEKVHIFGDVKNKEILIYIIFPALIQLEERKFLEQLTIFSQFFFVSSHNISEIYGAKGQQF